MKTVLGVLLGAVAYATIRYNVFKGVPWGDWPLYVLNKAFALASLVLLVIEGLRRNRARGEPLGVLAAAMALMLMHVAGSLALLGPAYYPEFFAGGKVLWPAGWALLLGVTAAVGFLMCLGPWERTGWKRLAQLGGITCLAGWHAALVGYQNWFHPESWPGHLPPISLISFLAGLLALTAGLWSRRRP